MRLTSTRLLLGRSLVAACVASAWLTAPGASVARAQAASGGTIAGLVTDASSRIGLAGVMLQLDGTRLGGTTGATGRYRLTNVPAGTYEVVARPIG
jgi:hypothetical protein